MSTHTHSPALSAERSAALALMLALLSVPGSTLAWDLPAGGFWIGVPLAVAAIVVARGGRGRRMATAATVIAVLMLAMTVVWTVASMVS